MILKKTPLSLSFNSFSMFFPVESYKEIQDSVCVAQRKADNSEERVLLFLKMAPGAEFTQELVKNLKVAIRSLLSARHVPEVILPIKDIPVSMLTPPVKTVTVYRTLSQPWLRENNKP